MSPEDDRPVAAWLAGYLQEIQKRPGWSVARVARESDGRLSLATVMRLAHGRKRLVDLDMVRLIATIVGDDPDEVLQRAVGSPAATAAAPAAQVSSPEKPPPSVAGFDVLLAQVARLGPVLTGMPAEARLAAYDDLMAGLGIGTARQQIDMWRGLAERYRDVILRAVQELGAIEASTTRTDRAVEVRAVREMLERTLGG